MAGCGKELLVVETGIAAPADPASVSATLRTVLTVLAPALAVGVIARRPSVFGVADRMGADVRAFHQVQRLAADYGPGPGTAGHHSGPLVRCGGRP
jgi:hypothetical protein